MRFKRGFKKSLGEIVDYEHYNKTKKRVRIALIILIIALVIFVGYLSFFYAKPCIDADCFVEAVENCKHVSWIREDEQASWLYVIKGDAKDDSCKIEVRLLKIKQGTIDSEKLEGKKMTCVFKKGQTIFPEKDISSCTGVLKEEMQDLLIQRMHNYLLQNIGEVREEFKKIV